jgi:hypothetical protein
MTGERLDALARRLVGERSRRTIARTLGGILGAGVIRAPAALAGRDRTTDPSAEACVPGRGACSRGDRCCDGRCRGGRCRCLRHGQSCDRDDDCCTGICDQYENTCADLRFGCNPNRAGQCKGGECCGSAPTPTTAGRCVYQNSTPGRFQGCAQQCGDCALSENCCPPARCLAGDCCCPSGETCGSGVPVCASL